MADEVSNIFSMSGLVKLYNKESTAFISFGSYNGEPEISVSPNPPEKGKQPCKAKLTNGKRRILCDVLSKVINSPRPNESLVVRFTKSTRQPDGKFLHQPEVVVQIGTDERSIIYIACEGYRDGSPKVSCKAALSAKGIDAKDIVMDAAASSLLYAQELCDFLKITLPISALFTRNNLYKPQNRGNQSSSSISSSTTSTSTDPSLDFSSNNSTYDDLGF